MFETHLPPACVHSAFDEGVVNGLIALQRSRCKRKRGSSPKHVLLVLDDMMYDKKVLKAAGMRDIFMNGRHLKITFINAMQYCMDMGPDLRSQIDYCFILRENVVSNRIKLWKYFFGGFENYDDFANVFTQCTENNECMVIDNTVKSNELSDMIFWYKATLDLPDYKVGDSKMWRVHNAFWVDPEDPSNLDAMDNGGHSQDAVDVEKCIPRKKQRITHICKMEEEIAAAVDDDEEDDEREEEEEEEEEVVVVEEGDMANFFC